MTELVAKIDQQPMLTPHEKAGMYMAQAVFEHAVAYLEGSRDTFIGCFGSGDEADHDAVQAHGAKMFAELCASSPYAALNHLDTQEVEHTTNRTGTYGKEAASIERYEVLRHGSRLILRELQKVSSETDEQQDHALWHDMYYSDGIMKRS